MARKQQHKNGVFCAVRADDGKQRWNTAKQQLHCNRGTVFPTRISDWAMLRYSRCELLLLKVIAVAEGSSGTQRKGNARRWKPLPEYWWGRCRLSML
jgi:hypothetical protein